MKVFALPEKKTNQALFFDMDSTLYTNNEYAQSQIDLPVKRLAKLQGKTFDDMSCEIAMFRKKWAADHDGKTISLSNIFLSYGISMADNIRWREELCRPEDYLVKDIQLRSVLHQLASRYVLAVVTNNPVSVAIRTLSVLDVYDIMQKIVGLDTCNVSKPDRAVFLKAAQLCDVPVQQCISVGDRYDIDISVPLELGMGGILVNGVEDVYKIPGILM
ncbi:MAG: HAD family hydrolase [Treponema sp.]|jgi:phosphoglycolate phosphatase/putative hydrolase of the HAD superfamily|nr:HAD family hydrolase [Treponema sp.]